MKKIILVFITLLLILTTGCNTVRTSFRYKDSEKYLVGEGTIAKDEVKKIKVEWAGTLAYITTYDGSDIHFYEEIDEGTSEKYQLHYYHNNDTLYIEPCASLLFPQFNFKTKVLHLEIPSSLTKDDLISFDLDLVSTRGEVRGLKAEDIDIDTVSGALTISAIDCEKIDIDSASGSITIDTVNGNSVDIDATSGSISLNNINAKVDIDVVSCNVDIYLAETDSFEIKLDSISGEITNELNVLKNSDGLVKYDIETVSGNITIHKK